MKIKRFKNLWTMGLILFGAILVLFYIAKIFFPEFIVGIAEIPSIVAFGKFVDSHWLANILFHIFISYFCGYFYYCACYKKYKLDLIENIFVLLFIILTIIAQNFLPKIYTPFLYVTFILQPFLMLLYHKNLCKETFISTSVSFTVDIMAQAFSLQIRDIILLTSSVNSATLTILAIDTIIWRILLYMYFNNKKESK